MLTPRRSIRRFKDENGSENQKSRFNERSEQPRRRASRSQLFSDLLGDLFRESSDALLILAFEHDARDRLRAGIAHEQAAAAAEVFLDPGAVCRGARATGP